MTQVLCLLLSCPCPCLFPLFCFPIVKHWIALFAHASLFNLRTWPIDLHLSLMTTVFMSLHWWWRSLLVIFFGQKMPDFSQAWFARKMTTCQPCTWPCASILIRTEESTGNSSCRVSVWCWDCTGMISRCLSSISSPPPQALHLLFLLVTLTKQS